MDIIRVGSIVKIFDKELEEEYTYRIVSGSREKSIDLSSDSALGKSLMYKRVGDIVTVRAEEEYKVKIINIDNSNVPSISDMLATMTNVNNPSPNKLVRNLHKGYGGKAQVIYDECCKRFGWDYSKRYLFGMLQILYAKEATPERFSPWFLPHNNLTDTKGGNWFNKIQGDIIEEMWLERDDRFYSDKTHRVTFVKNKSKEYIFLGIYKPVKEETIILKSNIMKDGKIIKKAGEKVGIKTYQLVFDSYPQ